MTRTLLIAALHLVAALAVAACSPGVADPAEKPPEPPPPEKPPVAEGYPSGYETWSKFNETPVVRKEHGEVRDLYYNPVAAGAGAEGPFPVGSVLVKAQHRLVGGQKGRLFQLSVMRKGQGPEYNGWEFESYEPDSGQKQAADADVCIICHTQRAQSDFVFSDRTELGR